MKKSFNNIFIIIIKYFNSFLDPKDREIKYYINKNYQINEKINDYELLNKIYLEQRVF
jgi:hypothetical protein